MSVSVAKKISAIHPETLMKAILDGYVYFVLVSAASFPLLLLVAIYKMCTVKKDETGTENQEAAESDAEKEDDAGNENQEAKEAAENNAEKEDDAGNENQEAKEAPEIEEITEQKGEEEPLLANDG